MAISSPSLSPTGRPDHVHPQARDFCTKSLALTLVVVGLIGLVCGVLAYHVATGQLSMSAFNSISITSSYAMIAGFTIITIGSGSLLAYFANSR